MMKFIKAIFFICLFSVSVFASTQAPDDENRKTQQRRSSSIDKGLIITSVASAALTQIIKFGCSFMVDGANDKKFYCEKAGEFFLVVAGTCAAAVSIKKTYESENGEIKVDSIYPPISFTARFSKSPSSDVPVTQNLPSSITPSVSQSSPQPQPPLPSPSYEVETPNKSSQFNHEDELLNISSTNTSVRNIAVNIYNETITPEGSK